MVSTNFSGVILVPFGGIANQIFHITLMISFKGVQRDIFD